MAVADELTTILGVEVAQNAMAKLESFKRGLDGLSKALVGLSVVAAVAWAGFKIKGVADEANELQKLSDKTKISTDTLQEWDYAAKRSGLDAKAVQNDLVSLQKTMSSPIPGQFNMTMAMFGVRARDASGKLKTTDQLMGDMAEKFKGMSTQRAAQWASKLGISDETTLLLRKGRDGIEELRKEAHKLGGIIPAESIKRAADFKKQLAELQFAFHGLTSQLAIAMIPALSRAVDRFKEWLARNQEWVRLGLSSVMEGVVSGFERFWGQLKKLDDKLQPVKDKTDEFKKKLDELTGGMSWAEIGSHLMTGALAGLLIFLAPILLKFGLFVLVAILLTIALEDLWSSITTGNGKFADAARAIKKFYNEHKTLLDLIVYSIGWFLAFKAAIAIEAGVKALATAIGAMAMGFRGLNAAMKANFFILIASLAIALAQVIYENWGAIKECTLNVVNAIGNAWDRFKKWFSDGWDRIANAVKGVWNNFKEWFLGIWSDMTGALPDFGAWASDSKAKIIQVWETIKQYFKDLWEEIKSYVPDFGAWGSKLKSAFSFGDKKGGAASNTVIPINGKPAQITVAAHTGRPAMQYTDNKTINQTISTSDPQQAANAAVTAINGPPPAALGGLAPAH